MHKSLLDYRDLIKNNLQLIKISTEVLESGLNLLDYKINDSSELNKSTNYLLDKIGIDTK